MSEKRTKADKAQRQADELEKKAFRRRAQSQKKKPIAVRIVKEATQKD